MPFVTNAVTIARAEMRQINPDLAEKYASLIRFLAAYPEAASAMRWASAPSIGSAEFIRKQAAVFASARDLRAPQAPATIPDDMVSVILVSYFGMAIFKKQWGNQVNPLISFALYG